MKRLVFCLVCALLCSCDPGWVFNPPYQSEWVIVNQTGRDVSLCIEKVYANDALQQCEKYEEYHILNNCVFYQKYQGEKEDRSDFLALFVINSNSYPLISSKVYITPIDGGSVLRVWNMGQDNGSRDLFDETQWVHESWVDFKNEKYTIYHNKWTFTITDADLVMEE